VSGYLWIALVVLVAALVYSHVAIYGYGVKHGAKRADGLCSECGMRIAEYFSCHPIGKPPTAADSSIGPSWSDSEPYAADLPPPLPPVSKVKAARGKHK
jgi:hypothetical protein